MGSKDDSLKDEEIEQLIAVAQTPKDKLIILLAAYTGMRASEIAHIKKSWLNYNIGKGVIIIPKEQACSCGECKKYRAGIWTPKTKKGSRIIPLLDVRLKDMCKSWFLLYDGLGSNRWNVWHRIKTLARKANLLTRVYPHCLRATFASKLAHLNLSSSSLKYFQGWANIKTAESYIEDSGARALDELKEKWK